MKFQHSLKSLRALFSLTGCSKVVLAILVMLAISAVALNAFAAIPWDNDGGDGIWFNPANWNRNSNDNNTLPPGGDAAGTAAATDTEISAGTATLNGGQGVIYNPTPGAPNFPVPDSVNDPPATFTYQKIAQLYISRAGGGQAFVTPDNTVTIMGDLELTANMIVGRSSGSLDTPTNGRVNQLSGLLNMHFNALDLGQRENSGGATPRIGFGNGIYDYRGGSMEVGLQASDPLSHGIRLSAGGSAGTGGIGRFIMHNPSMPGYVRTLNFHMAAHAGVAGSPAVSPNGSTIGVAIAEFHFENGGTRPVQVTRNLIINNGSVTTGTRSSRLDLVLDAAPTVDGGGVPQSLGLFDVDFAFDSTLGDNSSFYDGAISGTGALGLNLSSADGSSLYTQGSTVSATFGSTQYNWTISYTGKITWGTCDEVGGINTVCAAADAGTVGMIEATGGEDVVLIGLSSISLGLAGDFNEDDKVDAADYVVWRKNGANPLPNDNGLATSAERFDLWRANFGNMAPGSGSGVGAVPEPSAIVLVLLGAIGLMVGRRRSA
jgi:hypothetical protein